MESIVGRKMKGFKFESEPICPYTNQMDQFVGQVGTITYATKDWVNVNFGVSVENWSYPTDTAIQFLVG